MDIHYQLILELVEAKVCMPCCFPSNTSGGVIEETRATTLLSDFVTFERNQFVESVERRHRTWPCVSTA